ncbi:restriction endonuclease subunit S [Runella salmonicolor]|uniref:Restriction endonuclease subunit S n=1 Tax=Runella salmonicolor TaxID=2950278 RepID=A0ABT1FVL5_9BACT|nr:restriction endonuclease subunit S [Runella salmonicolor]MCP1385809.1 restriction endonuclease subunit S [Runella salmonicolor]
MKQGNALSLATEHSRSMPKGWEMKKLGEVAKAIYGYTEKASFEEIGPRFLRITDIQDEGVNWETVPFCKITDTDFNKYKLIDGDIVFARTGATTGKSYLVNNPPKSVFASYLIKVHINSGGLLPEYLFLFFQTKTYWDSINEGISGSAQGGFNATKLSDLYIPLPPLPEQQRIVAILDEAFAGIAKAKANAEQNLKNAKELFESYLQGVFKSKIEGDDSSTLDSLCELIVDCEHKTAPTQETGYPSIRTPNIGKGELILENVNRVSYETYVQWTRRAIPKAGDLILAREAPAGNIAVIPENIEVCLGQRTVLIRPKKDKLVSKYLAYLILSKDVQEKLLSHSTGATVEHVNMKDIRAFKIYNLSNITEQQAIVRKLDTLSAETKRLEAIYQQKINDLEELKKSVLQKAFSGELKTEKAEVTL